MKVYLETLGCKLNESELEAWSRKFTAEGNQIVTSPAEADICVLNTCTITSSAARKSRNLARQMARANPNVRLVLTGCYASTAPKDAQNLPNVTLVVPNGEKERLVELANELLPVAKCTVSAIEAKVDGGQLVVDSVLTDSLPANHHPLRTRAFVKIQDGCNMSCTYCIIPLARGKERSRPMTEIVSEVQSLVDSGYKEIILTGVQISEYRSNVTLAPYSSAGVTSPKWAKQSPYSSLGIDLSHPSTSLRSAQDALLAMSQERTLLLSDLVSAILNETNVPRLRLTSIAPWDLDESLLDLFSDVRLCRHLHLSLQSGSDIILRRMRRPYTAEQFARAAEMARAKIPDLAITTDVIVGFPGESDYEFEQSLAFVEQMQFARVHVFSYSARAGTLAAGLPLQVSDATKEARRAEMQAVADNAVRAFESRFIGRTMDVLWENAVQGKWAGYTDNYIRVLALSDGEWHNQITPAALNRVLDDAVSATILVGV